MRYLYLTILCSTLFLSNASYAEDNTIIPLGDGTVRFIERTKVDNGMLISRLCVGGYQFVLVCRTYEGQRDKTECVAKDQNPYQITQLFDYRGGGLSCKKN